MDFKWGYAVGGLMAGLGLSAGVAALYGLQIGSVMSEYANLLSAAGTVGTVAAAFAAAYSAKLSKDAAHLSAFAAIENERAFALDQAHALYLRAEKKARRTDQFIDDLLNASLWGPQQTRFEMLEEIGGHREKYEEVAAEAGKILSKVVDTHDLKDLLPNRAALKALNGYIGNTDWAHEQCRRDWLRRLGPNVTINDSNDVLAL